MFIHFFSKQFCLILTGLIAQINKCPSVLSKSILHNLFVIAVKYEMKKQKIQTEARRKAPFILSLKK